MDNLVNEKTKVIINYGVISNLGLLVFAVVFPFAVSLLTLNAIPGILPNLFQLIFTESIILIIVILKFSRQAFVKSKIVCNSESDKTELEKCISQLDKYRAIVTNNLKRHIKVRKQHNVDAYLKSIDAMKEYYLSLT